jgi:glycosyltransferase involved in cell wall biosynthesis
MTYENKRVDRLLDIWGMIFERVPDWELILVGGGQEKETYNKILYIWGLKRVVFAGGTSNVQPFYDDASVFCLTSTLKDGLFA